MAKTKIRLFSLTGECDIFRVIDSPTSWSTNETVLKASYVKNQKAVSITTTLRYLVEESDSDDPELTTKAAFIWLSIYPAPTRLL